MLRDRIASEDTLAQDGRRTVGEVEHGGRRSLKRVALAEVDGDVLPEQLMELVARLHRGIAGAVRARDGERTRLREQRERERVVRGADADRRRVPSQVPRRGGRAAP